MMWLEYPQFITPNKIMELYNNGANITKRKTIRHYYTLWYKYTRLWSVFLSKKVFFKTLNLTIKSKETQRTEKHIWTTLTGIQSVKSRLWKTIFDKQHSFNNKYIWNKKQGNKRNQKNLNINGVTDLKRLFLISLRCDNVFMS